MLTALMPFSISALASATVLMLSTDPGATRCASRWCGRLRATCLENFRIVGGVLADREERGPHAFIGQRLEHGGRGRPRAVVEGQHHFLVAQEVVLLEVLEAEARAAGGVDLDRAADAERVRIGALRRRDRARRGRARRRGSRGGCRRGRRCGGRTGGWSPLRGCGPSTATDADINKTNATALRIQPPRTETRPPTRPTIGMEPFRRRVN